jgi:hypothetical protein
VDLGIYDAAGTLRGWSGSQRTEAFLSESSSTKGYQRCPIESGRWAVALGIYKVESELRVDVAVTLVPKARILLAGDLHMHTLNSDGDYPTAQVIENCRRAKLDFMALTDHNNTEQNGEIGRPEDITVIPGMEYTNYRGHANFFFPSPSVSMDLDPLSNSFAEVQAVFRRAKELGAVISLNHTHCEACPWDLGFDELPFDMVEVWNGPMKDAEVRAIAWWHERLRSGKRLAAVGGSDTHRYEPFRMYAFPTTFVHSASRSERDILSALVAGRSFLSQSPSGPFPDLRIGSAGLGDAVPYSGGLEGAASVRAARRGDLVRLLDGAGGKTERTVPFDGDFRFAFPVESPEQGFFRLEILRDRMGIPTIAALTNPVFIEADGELRGPSHPKRGIPSRQRSSMSRAPRADG